jgi:hypothetical protein
MPCCPRDLAATEPARPVGAAARRPRRLQCRSPSGFSRSRHLSSVSPRAIPERKDHHLESLRSSCYLGFLLGTTRLRLEAQHPGWLLECASLRLRRRCSGTVLRADR